VLIVGPGAFGTSFNGPGAPLLSERIPGRRRGGIGGAGDNMDSVFNDVDR
jgi:hypothetical protein